MEFPSILTTGKRYNSEHLLLYVAKDYQDKKSENSRFAFSVSKKVCKNATDRNKLRRQGYSLIGKYTKKIKPGFLCFFSLKKNSKNINFQSFEKEVSELLSMSSMLE